MQKVILISLTSFELTDGVSSTEEVLGEYTKDGWKVINVAATSAGAGAGYGSLNEGGNYVRNLSLSTCFCGWFLVTLEKI